MSSQVPSQPKTSQPLFDEQRTTQREKIFATTSQLTRSHGGDATTGSSYKAKVARTDFWLFNTSHPFLQQDADAKLKLIRKIVFSAHTGVPRADAKSSRNKQFFIVPSRAISPKSSKAMDILRGIFPKQLDEWQGQLLEMGYCYEQLDEYSITLPEFWAQVCDPMTARDIERSSLTKYFDYLDSHEYATTTADKLGLIDMTDSTELARQNTELGLAISPDELHYLQQEYARIGRHQATDAELLMFAQLNSEHCRHKIFNGAIQVVGADKGTDAGTNEQASTLFSLIKETSKNAPSGLVSAYSDNAAVFHNSNPQQRLIEIAMNLLGGKKGTTDRKVSLFSPDPNSNNNYRATADTRHLIFKAETHNHPTFVSPNPGAATGTGGEIRDEIACGKGGRTKAGFVGFSLSDLLMANPPSDDLPKWEEDFGMPEHKASALDIIIDAPLGSSNYGNEFGRPTLGGYFRTLSCVKDGVNYGYHKPIMLAGGWGDISHEQALKPDSISANYYLVLIGDLSLKIGIGGGALSSVPSQSGDYQQDSHEIQRADLDFASVQRANPEVERRGVEAIMASAALGKDNPIHFIHDLGAGGLGNAVAELLRDGKCGGKVVLENIPVGDSSMTAAEIWCNESQERFILAVAVDKLASFAKICHRENAPYVVIGITDDSDELQLRSYDEQIPTEQLARIFSSQKKYIDIVKLPLASLFPNSQKQIYIQPYQLPTTDFGDLPTDEQLKDYAGGVLTLPSVASKQFLITIVDRFVGGLTAREQMAGPWQIPVNDYGATLADFDGFAGEASALGERTPLAVLNPAASARMALAEVVSNLAASGIRNLNDIKLCANWMAATDQQGEMAKLYEAVRVTSHEMCQQLNLAIPVGKDSLFMSAKWNDEHQQEQQVISPVSLIMSGLAQVEDLSLGVDAVIDAPSGELSQTSSSATSDKQTGNSNLAEDRLITDATTPSLWLVTPRQGANRLGGTAFAQVYKRWQGDTPDIDKPQQVADFFAFVSTAVQQQQLLAYHDVSDGGLWACLCEIAFASNCGLEINLDELLQVAGQDPYTALFGEEMGAVVQISQENEVVLKKAAAANNINLYQLGMPLSKNKITIKTASTTLIAEEMTRLRAIWSSVSDQVRRQRDVRKLVNKEAALLGHIPYQEQGDEKTKLSTGFNYQGIREKLSQSFKPIDKCHSILNIKSDSSSSATPKVAILREQGVNSHVETAFAFEQAGFTAVDVHMNDLRHGTIKDLNQFSGLVFAGGFAYGDVMGAGVGWAANIMHNPKMKQIFADFFQRADSFSLGICNGCQVMARLQEIIPGADWNCNFLLNNSQVFEARTTMVKIMPSPSIFFIDMQDSIIPIALAHGEGRASFHNDNNKKHLQSKIDKGEQSNASMIYTDAQGSLDAPYPLNPNGSDLNIASLTSQDGRATILMPHPERTLKRINQCWRAKQLGNKSMSSKHNQETESPWQSIFYNARLWIKATTGQ